MARGGASRKDEAIQAALRCNGSVKAMAEDLGVTLYTAYDYRNRWHEVKEILEAQKPRKKAKDNE